MFESARLKLTAWYLLIIMFISVFFSIIIYKFLDNELRQFAVKHRYRLESLYPQRVLIVPDPQIIEEIENRIIFTLAVINGIILVASGGIGYFLAGRTLQPIKDMVDEQNRFIADASHEFRTPLTSLKSNIEVTLTDKKLTITEAKKVFKENLEDVNELQKLSDALLQLAQFQSRNGNHFESVSIKSIIENSIKKISQQAKKKQIKVEDQAEDKKFIGDPERLSELLVILLDNAIKYSPENSSVTIGSKHTRSQMHLFISDEGIGIPEKDIPHIFDRFYRADKSRSKNEVTGYGLGLSIAKKIVKAHHGSLTVKSKLKEGTTFTIIVPVKHSA